MQRPANYKTKQGEAVLEYLLSVKEMFVTAAQIVDHMQKEGISISRPTVYRHLEKLVSEGRVRKYLFDGISVSHFQYVDADEYGQGLFHMRCEVCDEVLSLKCDEVDHVSQHILEAHAFQVNNSKTIFYGRCKMCLHE